MGLAEALGWTPAHGLTPGLLVTVLEKFIPLSSGIFEDSLRRKIAYHFEKNFDKRMPPTSKDFFRDLAVDITNHTDQELAKRLQQVNRNLTIDPALAVSPAKLRNAAEFILQWIQGSVGQEYPRQARREAPETRATTRVRKRHSSPQLLKFYEGLGYFSRSEFKAEQPSEGRLLEDEEEIVDAFLEEQTQVLMISGSGGVGKTMLAHELTRILVMRSHRLNPEYHYASIHDVKIIDKKWKSPTCLLLDYAERMPSAEECIRFLESDTGNLLVLTTRESSSESLRADFARFRPFHRRIDPREESYASYHTWVLRKIITKSLRASQSVCDSIIALCASSLALVVFYCFQHVRGLTGADHAVLRHSPGLADWLARKMPGSSLNKIAALVTSLPATREALSESDHLTVNALIDDGVIEHEPITDIMEPFHDVVVEAIWDTAIKTGTATAARDDLHKCLLEASKRCGLEAFSAFVERYTASDYPATHVKTTVTHWVGLLLKIASTDESARFRALQAMLSYDVPVDEALIQHISNARKESQRLFEQSLVKEVVNKTPVGRIVRRLKGNALLAKHSGALTMIDRQVRAQNGTKNLNAAYRAWQERYLPMIEDRILCASPADEHLRGRMFCLLALSQKNPAHACEVMYQIPQMIDVLGIWKDYGEFGEILSRILAARKDKVGDLAFFVNEWILTQLRSEPDEEQVSVRPNGKIALLLISYFQAGGTLADVREAFDRWSATASSDIKIGFRSGYWQVLYQAFVPKKLANPSADFLEELVPDLVERLQDVWESGSSLSACLALARRLIEYDDDFLSEVRSMIRSSFERGDLDGSRDADLLLGRFTFDFQGILTDDERAMVFSSLEAGVPSTTLDRKAVADALWYWNRLPLGRRVLDAAREWCKKNPEGIGAFMYVWADRDRRHSNDTDRSIDDVIEDSEFLQELKQLRLELAEQRLSGGHALRRGQPIEDRFNE
ncbi:hypothetical protein C0V75_21665 [Tabrizicola sp. TH137]|nr:hypothetical protein C0V75_21665 [Tabrizicola sp. TH137]